jgi:predicted amidohydrolase YtcJ
LELAGIKPNQQLTGGEIETKNGLLTGLLIDNAVDAISAKILLQPKPIMKLGCWLHKNCFAQGLTTITDCGLMYNDVEQIDALQKQENYT